MFHGYDELAGQWQRAPRSLVAMEPGDTTAYAMKGAEDRGSLFINPGAAVYEAW